MAGSLVSVFTILLALSLAAATSLTHDPSPPAIFVFGDSLSDVGNNNYLPDAPHANFPHYGVDFPGGVPTGRFTNGYNFIDVIAQQMGFEQSPPAYFSLSKTEDVLKGVNFACGGSGILLACSNETARTCVTMEEQIQNFQNVRALLQLELGNDASRELISDSIFLFTCGGNDLNYFFGRNFPIPKASIDDYVQNLTSTLRDQLKEVYNLGGRKFAIVNVPAIGKTPPVVLLGFLPQFTLNIYASKFNSAENEMLEELSSTLPGMKYSIGNAYAALTDVINSPREHGIKNVASPCCGRADHAFAIPPVKTTYCSPEATLCSNRSEYVFWDHLHPTQRVIEYAGGLFYSGNPPYANPINMQQLGESESSRGGALGSLGAFEAM